MDAFAVTPERLEREDIQALNRLSSLIYIMMVQLVSGHYLVGFNWGDSSKEYPKIEVCPNL